MRRFWLGLLIAATVLGAVSAKAEDAPSDKSAADVADLRLKLKIYEILGREWVRPLPEPSGVKALEANASRWAAMTVAEMLADIGVDEHTRYFSPDELETLDAKGAKPAVVSEASASENVSSRFETGDIGYVRIQSFKQGASRDARVAIVSMAQQGLAGLVLDLRGNEGGLLSECLDLADLFLSGGEIVRLQGRDDAEAYRAERETVLNGAPLIVLVDSVTATGAELIAMALQSRQRAKIVGMQTAGKGHVGVFIPLSHEGRPGALKVTAAYMVGPGGETLENRGVTPDRIVKNAEDALAVALAAISTP